MNIEIGANLANLLTTIVVFGFLTVAFIKIK
jgi:hypothetical protein